MDNQLRKRALDGELDALMAATKELMRPADNTRKEAAMSLLRAAWTGSAEAAHKVALDLLARAPDSFYTKDRDLGILWLRQAAQKDYKEARELLPAMGAVDMNSYRDPFMELEALVGLGSVKTAITEQADRMAFLKLREKQGLPLVPSAAIHLVFAGNPGTGKTTVARIFGRLLKNIGYLRSGHVVEVSVHDIIGKWVGETPQKVAAKVAEALDGVLFIDEAYGLMGHTTVTGNSYGAEAITTLLKLMEDHRDRLVVIAAGYTGRMNEFLEYNPGLKSRFTEVITFHDYSPAEMTAIYLKLMAEGKYALTIDAQVTLDKIMQEAPQLFPENFPNGRLVRNLFEDTIKYAASRVMRLPQPTRSDLVTITDADILLAFKELNAGQ
ncbi:MAG: AAA family ATPase [Micavibrio sp.]|nr:AAA family ATPase [Micavibrio sp.]